MGLSSENRYVLGLRTWALPLAGVCVELFVNYISMHIPSFSLSCPVASWHSSEFPIPLEVAARRKTRPVRRTSRRSLARHPSRRISWRHAR
jgi:hypothetical protein